MACGALTVWVQPIWVLHWYHLLRDREHFVIARSPEDLRHRLAFYRRNPSCAHTIAKRGHEVISQYLSEHGSHCYWATLLRGFASKLPFNGQLHNDAQSIDATLWAELRQYADKKAETALYPEKSHESS